MRSEVGIAIEAPPALVFALAHDVERWATLLPHYSRSRAIRRRPDGGLLVEFVARRPLIRAIGLELPVAWRSVTSSEPGTLRLSFVHVGGATAGMHVQWRIEPVDDGGSDVVIEHTFAPRVPGFAWFVDRWFTRPIAGRTLATFKALAEALQSDRTSAANPAP